MDTKQLKAKILDLAVHGKLLPLETLSELKNSPDYEPASKLLEKLRAEKEEKIAKGELKRDKKDSYIFIDDDNRHYEKFADGSVKDIEDEIPFEAPEGWAWCMLGMVGDWKSGSTPNRKNIDFYENGTIPWLLTGDLNDGIIKNIPNKITKLAYAETSLKLNPKGSVCIAMYGATIGKLGILDFPATTNQACCVCSDFKGIDNLYLFYCLKQHKNIFIQQGFGGAQPNISKEKIISTLVPLPPLAEQKRIVSELERIFSLIDSLETDKSALQLAVKQAKAKILDLAIHGKLVPQAPADEPASALLEKLRAEKEAKIAKGELKRDKNDSFIYKSTTDNCHYEKFADGTEEEIEVPFEVPDNWSWCHFGDIADVINGRNQSKVVDDNGLYPIYGSGGIMGRANDFLCPENCTIIGRKGSINNPIFVEEKFWNVDTAFGLAPTSSILPKYLFYFCKSFDFTALDSSTTLPSLTKTSIQQILFPLPSLSEQQRIINKIENLFEYLDQIALNLV